MRSFLRSPRALFDRSRLLTAATALAGLLLAPVAFGQTADDDDDPPVINAPNPVAGSDGRLNYPDPSRGQGAGGFWTPRAGNRHHNGVDIAAPVGTPVQSRGDGVVTRSTVYPTYSTPLTPPATVVPPVPLNGAGNRVYIRDRNGYEWRYDHLDGQNQPTVGARVMAGQVIGEVGRTGNVPPRADSHLHHEVWYQGHAINPNVPFTPSSAPASTPIPAPTTAPSQGPAQPAPAGAPLYNNENAPQPARGTSYVYDSNWRNTADPNRAPANTQATVAPTVPDVAPRAYGTQSPTAALRFPR